MDQTRSTPGLNRRHLLIRVTQGVLAVTALALLRPLFRFTGFTVKRKPRHIVVHKTLPARNVYTEHDFILFILATGPLAVSRICTHLGCRVNYRKELGLIECPCHQSRFTRRGKRVAGPAKRNLPTYPVKIIKDNNGKATGYMVTL